MASVIVGRYPGPRYAGWTVESERGELTIIPDEQWIGEPAVGMICLPVPMEPGETYMFKAVPADG